jgi:hypothetical protein
LGTAKCSGLVLADSVLDALVSERSLAQRVPLAKGVGALPPSGEVEVSVVPNRLAVCEISPVETTLLLVIAHVVAVVGCAKVVKEIPSGDSLLGGEASNQKSVS